MEKRISTRFFQKRQLLITRLCGVLNGQDICRWSASLENAFRKIPDNGKFKILVNLHGFRAADMETHKRFRTIMPALLADYGYRIGYLDMFPEANVELKNTRGIRCVAMANVHHEETKMNDYQARFGSDSEAYFTDPAKARNWILQL